MSTLSSKGCAFLYTFTFADGRRCRFTAWSPLSALVLFAPPLESTTSDNQIL
jgi:hypothetical protein